MLERSVGAARISHARRAVFMHPLRTPSTFTIPVVLALSLGACRGSEEAPLVSVTVDPSLSPRVESLPGFDDGQPRPLAVATDIDGEPAVFVANELWVSTDDAEGLEALLARWGGEVIASLEPGAFDLSFLPTQHLIRVDASAADVALLGEHIREIDADVTGDYTVSSDEGLALLAAAAEEAASGHALGVNWVGEGAQFLDRNVTEGPEGPSGYQPNPFEWPSHSIDASQETGVAEAWRALDFADRLGERVGVAILDMGFSPDIDTPGDMVAISNVPGVNPIDRDNILHCGDPCPWHGTNVRSAAMAVPDNGFGSAGPAGPVARPILVFTLYDFFTSITRPGRGQGPGRGHRQHELRRPRAGLRRLERRPLQHGHGGLPGFRHVVVRRRRQQGAGREPGALLRSIRRAGLLGAALPHPVSERGRHLCGRSPARFPGPAPRLQLRSQRGHLCLVRTLDRPRPGNAGRRRGTRAGEERHELLVPLRVRHRRADMGGRSVRERQ
jgi:hypothetical protein